MNFLEIKSEELESRLRGKENWEIDHARIWLAKQYLNIEGQKLKFRIPSKCIDYLSGDGKIKISINPNEIVSERNEIIMWSELSIPMIVSLVERIFLKKTRV